MSEKVVTASCLSQLSYPMWYPCTLHELLENRWWHWWAFASDLSARGTSETSIFDSVQHQKAILSPLDGLQEQQQSSNRARLYAARSPQGRGYLRRCAKHARQIRHVREADPQTISSVRTGSHPGTRVPIRRPAFAEHPCHAVSSLLTWFARLTSAYPVVGSEVEMHTSRRMVLVFSTSRLAGE